MSNATTRKPSYEMEGYYFQEGGKTTFDNHFHYSDRDSMTEHQCMWYEEVIKLTYRSAIATIRANYKGELADEQLLAIVHDGTLMDTPFGELFPKKINTYVVVLLESKYGNLEAYVSKTKRKKIVARNSLE